jgi:hypothetical protein
MRHLRIAENAMYVPTALLLERRPMVPDASDYATLVAKAEEAVKSVKDPELRRVAFQKVLDDLLASKPTSQRRAPEKRRSKVATSEKSKKGGPQAYVREMVDDGFFKKPKTIALVRAELENRGHHIPITSLSGPLQKLCQQRVLRRQRSKRNGKKTVFTYTEW